MQKENQERNFKMLEKLVDIQMGQNQKMRIENKSRSPTNESPRNNIIKPFNDSRSKSTFNHSMSHVSLMTPIGSVSM